MQSAKKSTKVLSALTMAAGAAVGTMSVHAAHGATLTLFWGQDTSLANSNNVVAVGTALTKAGSGTNATGGTTYLTGTNTIITGLSQTGSVAGTVTVPVGDYLSLAIDAVLTGDVNADAGNTAGGAQAAQPSYLGLSALSVGISSTDSTATFLTPIALNATLLEANGYNGNNTYTDFAKINGSGGSKTTSGATKQGSNSTAAGGVAPDWTSLAKQADVQPNISGFDQGDGNGNVGLNGYTTAGSLPPGVGTNINMIAGFASQSNTANYANATDYEDSIMFEGLAAGTVTLSPYVAADGSSYWLNSAKGTPSGASSQYTVHTMTSADTINKLPSLVVVIPGATSVSSSHAIISLATTAAANSNYGSTVGTLTLVGSGGGYSPVVDSSLNPASPATGNVNVATWNAATDPEIFGIDVEVNGLQATSSQLATLIAAIDGDGIAPPSSGVAVSTTDPSAGHVLASLDPNLNLYLDFAAGGPATADNLGIDLSNSNDSNLTGYTFTAVAAVPEPMTLGLLAIGGVGLMARRNRRRS
jgi:hypothetical protein